MRRGIPPVGAIVRWRRVSSGAVQDAVVLAVVPTDGGDGTKGHVASLEGVRRGSRAVEVQSVEYEWEEPTGALMLDSAAPSAPDEVLPSPDLPAPGQRIRWRYSGSPGGAWSQARVLKQMTHLRKPAVRMLATDGSYIINIALGWFQWEPLSEGVARSGS